MEKQDILTTLQQHETDLRQRGVIHASLFGSKARGDSTPASDIDIMIELEPDLPLDIFGYAGLKRYIGELFVGRVDVVDREALKPCLRGKVENDEIRAF